MICRLQITIKLRESVTLSIIEIIDIFIVHITTIADFQTQFIFIATSKLEQLLFSATVLIECTNKEHKLHFLILITVFECN